MSQTVYTLRVSAATRLNAFLRLSLPPLLHTALSNGKIRRLIIAGAVDVQGRQCRLPSYALRAGETVAVRIDPEKLRYEKQPDDIAFDLTARDVLFEDDYLLVVNKPALFPTEAGMVGSRDNLHAAVVRYLTEKTHARNPCYAGTVHRLDRETSGAVLFAKTRAVNVACHALFETRAVQKIYRAVVFPAPARSQFTVELYMGRISPKSQAAKWGALSPKDGGVYSRTDFVVAKTGMLGKKPYTALDCTLHTGRTHQIRVHLASVGSPLVGDTLYGGIAFERMLLHARTLSFVHPVTQEPLVITAPVPALPYAEYFGLSN